MHRHTRQSTPRRCPPARSCLLLAVAGIAAAGCAAPPRTTANPTDTLAGRQLFLTEQALIYATSEPAAAQVAANLASVTRDFQKATGHTVTGKGLIIVTDRNDPPFIADRVRQIQLMRRHESLRSFTPPTTLPATMDETLRQADEKLGPDLFSKIILSKCGSMDPAEAIREWHLAGRPAATASWVLAVPTRELIQDAMHATFQKAMSQKDVPAAQKLLIGPLMVLVEARVREQATVDREIGLFCVLVWNDPALDCPAKKTQFVRYQKQRNQAVQQETNLPGLPTTQPVTSQAAASAPAENADKE